MDHQLVDDQAERAAAIRQAMDRLLDRLAELIVDELESADGRQNFAKRRSDEPSTA